MRQLIHRTEILRSTPRARTLLLNSSGVTPPIALYRKLSNWQLRVPPPYVYRRKIKYALLVDQGTPPMPPTPPVPSIVTLGPNSSQVVFASIDYQATVISQYANWS